MTGTPPYRGPDPTLSDFGPTDLATRRRAVSESMAAKSAQLLELAARTDADGYRQPVRPNTHEENSR